MTKYLGVIGNRDHIKIGGEKRPYWEFLDSQPCGWLTSLVYARQDLPDTDFLVVDCGAWSYRLDEVPAIDGESVWQRYARFPEKSIVVAPDHMLIPGVDADARKEWNAAQAKLFLKHHDKRFVPMAVVHGRSIDERVESALFLAKLGYEHIAIGGIAAQASRKALAMAAVAAVRSVTQGRWLHVLGLSSPEYLRQMIEIGVDSCDGSSHFKQAFTGGAYFTQEGTRLVKHQAGRPGEPVNIVADPCDCLACRRLSNEGIDTRSYGSNEHNMGRAAHNQNMLMRAHAVVRSGDDNRRLL